MPPLKPAHDPVLGVVDTTGRLAAGRQAVLSSTAKGWTLEEIEQDFQKVVAQATGRNPPAQLATHRAFVADLLLLVNWPTMGRLPACDWTRQPTDL